MFLYAIILSLFFMFFFGCLLFCMILLCLSSEELLHAIMCTWIFVVGARELQKWVAQNVKFWAMMLVGSLAVGQSPHGLLLAASVLMGVC